MKKIVITGYQEFGDQPDNKNIVAFGEESMDANDGYHTFTELYEHRITLFIALCKLLNRKTSSPIFEGMDVFPVWRSKLHSDGSAFEGWFILGINKEQGRQMTYHLPLSKWGETGFAETLERAPEYDGHSSNDVLERLNKM